MPHNSSYTNKDGSKMSPVQKATSAMMAGGKHSSGYKEKYPMSTSKKKKRKPMGKAGASNGNSYK